MIKTIDEQIISDWEENSHHMIDISYDDFKKEFDNVFQKISNTFNMKCISFQIEPACSVLFEIETTDKKIVYLTNRFDEDCVYYMIYQKGKFPMFKKSKTILSRQSKFEETKKKIKKYFSKKKKKITIFINN